MIKIIRNLSNLKAETKSIKRKLEKLQEDIDYYSNELEIVSRFGSQFQIDKTRNKLRKLEESKTSLLDSL